MSLAPWPAVHKVARGNDARPLRTAFYVALLAVLLASVFEAAALWRFYRAQTRLPLWDMAGHGWGGVELLRALEQGRPLQFLDLLNRQDKWPFGYSLLLLPFLAAADASFASAALFSTVLFVLTPLLLLWAAREVDFGPAGLWAGLLAAALFLAAPVPRVLAILVMRETAGIVFSLLALCLYLRARRLDTSSAWHLAGLSFLALVLIKYNYALVWGLAVLVHEVWRMPPDRRRELARRAARLLWPWHQPHWGRIVLALYLDLLVLAVLAGINPGVGIYAGLVIGAAVFAGRFLRYRQKFKDRWRQLPVEIRALLATVVIPLWIWCLSPSPIHPKSVVAFLRNRAAGPPLLSGDSLLFYFRSLARDYAPTPILGLLVVLGLILALLRLRRSGEPFRLLALTAFLGLGLAVIHPYKEIRFLAVTAPLLMLAAALAFSRAIYGREPAPVARQLLAALACSCALAGIGWTAVERVDLDARLARDYKLYSGRPGLWRALEFLAGRAAGAPRVAVIGTFNELSDNLVRWWLAMQEETRGVTVVRSPLRPDAKPPSAEARQRVRRWLARERPSRILAIRLLPSSRLYRSRDFQLYNAWQLATIEVLEKDPAWRVTRRRKLAGLGLEILVLDRDPGSTGALAGPYRLSLRKKTQPAWAISPLAPTAPQRQDSFGFRPPGPRGECHVSSPHFAQVAAARPADLGGSGRGDRSTSGVGPRGPRLHAA